MEFTLEFFSNDRYDILKLLCHNQIKVKDDFYVPLSQQEIADIAHFGYEVKTKNKVKCFETQYKLNPETFEKEINSDGTANKFNQEAGIYELDKSMKYLQEKLNDAINAIVDDIEVKIEF